MSKLTTSGIIREAMAMAIDKASRGELPVNDGKNIMGLCNAITSSLTAELKHQEMQSKLGREVPLLGQMNVGNNHD